MASQSSLASAAPQGIQSAFDVVEFVPARSLAKPNRGGDQRIPRPAQIQPGGHAPWAQLPAPHHISVTDIGNALANRTPGHWGPVLAVNPSPPELASQGWHNSGLPDDYSLADPSGVLVLVYDDDDGTDATSAGANDDDINNATSAGANDDDDINNATSAGADDNNGSTQAHVVLTRRARNLRVHAGEVSFPGGRREPDDDNLWATALREANEEISLRPDAELQLLGRLDSFTTPTSNSVACPFVVATTADVKLHANPAEVDAILRIELTDLLHPDAFRQEHWTMTNGETRTMTFFDLEGDTIWGATARTLRLLLELLTKRG